MTLLGWLDEDLKKPFLFSLIAHSLLILFFVSFSFLENKEVIKKSLFSNPQVKILSSAVRVDVVAMPKETLKELKEATLAPPVEVKEVKANAEKSKEESEETDDENSLKKFDSKKSFMNLLKKFSGKDLTKSDKANGKTGNKGNSKSLEDVKGLILYGNRLAKGNSVTGTNQNFDEGAFAMYVSLIPSRVKPFWRLPSYLLGRNLKCRIRIFINQNGELIKTSVFESSGVAEFDEKAISAIEQAAPFDRPEESYLSKLVNGEIALGFPL